jgi:hypothetical protein
MKELMPIEDFMILWEKEEKFGSNQVRSLGIAN